MIMWNKEKHWCAASVFIQIEKKKSQMPSVEKMVLDGIWKYFLSSTEDFEINIYTFIFLHRYMGSDYDQSIRKITVVTEQEIFLLHKCNRNYIPPSWLLTMC